MRSDCHRPKVISPFICCLAGCLFVWSGSHRVSAAEPQLAFQRADEAGYYHFDTGTLRGTLRLDGRAQGINELKCIPANATVTKGGGRLSLLSPYRIFSTGRRFGDAARDWPSTSDVSSDGTVQVRFPAAPEHPLEIAARYQLAAPDTIEVTFMVTPQQDMPQFELFLSSYFAAGYPASVYLQPNRMRTQDAPEFVSVDYTPLFDGNYLIFPRDREAVLRIHDGRWEIPPHPVQWCITRPIAAPLALRRNPETNVTAVMMARPKDCFAVAMPYNRQPPDGVAGHDSLYLSLFGYDVAAGQTVQATARLIVAHGLDDGQVVKRYEDFLRDDS